MRLGQILINLLNNAIKFTEHGQIGVTVRLLEQVWPPGPAALRVRDTGIGMNPSRAPGLFQAFTQVDGSITHQIRRHRSGFDHLQAVGGMMGGAIGWNRRRAPAAFSPSRRASASARPPGARGARCRRFSTACGPWWWTTTRRLGEILGEALRGASLRVETLASGGEAIAALRQADADDPYRLVFVDWKMPEMDGIEVIRRIKRDST